MFSGTTIAPGIALGPAMIWAPKDEPVQIRQVPAESVPGERHRFELARRRADHELEEIALRVASTIGRSAAAIFAAHSQLLRDPGFIEAILKRIEGERLAAESAVRATIEANVRRFAALSNSYLAARAQDLVEIGNRLLAHLRQGERGIPELSGPCVLIADSLDAADVIALDRRNLLALVLIQSGAISHAALLAATLGVPVVGGIPQLSGRVHEGDTVVVDGNHGHVLVNPQELTLREYRTRRELFTQFSGELAGLRASEAAVV